MGVVYLATTEEINAYLCLVRSINKIDIIPSEKNRKTRYHLGITVEDQKRIIRHLQRKDYVSGPERDKDPTRSGDVWIFKRFEFGVMFYVKIKIEVINEVKALSCHIDNIIA